MERTIFKNVFAEKVIDKKHQQNGCFIFHELLKCCHGIVCLYGFTLYFLPVCAFRNDNTF